MNVTNVTRIAQRFIRRIAVVTAGLAWSAVSGIWPAGPAAAADLPYLVDKEVFVQAPDNKTAVWVTTCYTQTQGVELKRMKAYQVRSDTADVFEQSWSGDNGKTWSDWSATPMPPVHPPDPPAAHRRYLNPGWVDPVNGRLFVKSEDAVLPNDIPTEGYHEWVVYYQVSADGGRTFPVNEQVIQTGDWYNSSHPVNGVYVGYNCIMPQVVGVPVRTPEDKVLVPVQISRSAAGVFDSAVLIGTWTDESPGSTDLTMQWDLSQRVLADTGKSSRGLFDPTIAQMPDGRILMVMRGSNQGISAPGRKWYSVSSDGGYTWSPAGEWTYSDGAGFYSPSSCSQLIETSFGRYYWIGNICASNPIGNSPRYPLVIGEVDPTSMLLMKDTVVTIDARAAAETMSLQLSNFSVYEDRVTHELVLNMVRFVDTGSAYGGDCYIYRIAVPTPEPSSFVLLVFGVGFTLVFALRKRRQIFSRNIRHEIKSTL